MQLTEFLQDLSERLSHALPPQLHALKKDWDKTIHDILTSAFARLDIVTREEFDAQTKVLTRTRKKVEQLEAELTALEKKRQSETGN